jgi:3-oxoacyl-[acyl-carrier-protein] synthase III
MSWVRALDVSDKFLKSGEYKHIMVVTGEFNVYEHLYPDLWKIKSLEQIEYTIPAYTIGEAASSTILSVSANKWQYNYDSVPELVNLCTIPLEGHESFYRNDSKINLHGIYKFVSFSTELLNSGKKRLISLVRRNVSNINEPDIWFPHAASSTLWEEMGVELGIKPEKNYISVYPLYGNVVSASIPVAMHMALVEKKLSRGKKVILWPGSAGMAFSVVKFIH